MKKILSIVAAVLLFSTFSKAQTADVTEGCAPLTVNFTAPNQASYFWDFKDAASSVEQNPENVFTVAGTYTVQLFEIQGGPLIGEVEIKVYPDVIIDIDATNNFGCIDLITAFTSSIQSHPAVVIESINWTFGDGNTAIGESTMNTYTFAGIFDISIDLKTNLLQCDKTQIFDNIVEAEDLSAELVLPDEIPCKEPASIIISSGLQQDTRYTYEWNFGNNTSSTAFEPGEITYENFGTYDIWLRIESPSGCVDTSFTELTIGPAPVDLEYPSSVCVGQTFVIQNATLENRFDWRYGDPLMRKFDRNLELKFDEPGVQTITLLSSSSSSCVRETVFDINVEEPNPLFILEPEFACSEEVDKQFIANDPNLAEYIWNDVAGGSVLTVPGLSEPRNDLHINQPDSIEMKLEVTSAAGCKADTTLKFDFRLAEAYFIPDQIIGFNTLDVTFFDFSESSSDIVRRYWIYDDGIEAEVGADIIEHSHTYDCGEYFPRLVIEDANGCIDTSKRVKIRVICPDDIIAGGGGGEPNPSDPIPGGPGSSDVLCVNDGGSFLIPPSAYDFHYYADDYRLSHCWLAPNPITHQFKFPGVFPLTVIREYEGLFIDTVFTSSIEVFGARSEILYEKNCTNRFEVTFTSNSINADELRWMYDGATISTAETFSHTFDQPGEHMVSLEATSLEGGCDPDLDEVIIYIPELKAHFEFTADKICDSDSYILDASQSQGVFASCHKGYKWIFENQRPRETGEAQLEHTFLRGDQNLTLVVEDINGCTDTLTKPIKIYGIDANFNVDSTSCLPYDKDFVDASDADTTLVSWEWSFGSNEQNPSYTFDEVDINPDKKDTITIQLIVNDVLGCKDTLNHDVRIVDPNFFINSQSGSRVCIGETALFNAIDTAGIKDDYTFYWDIDGITQDTGFMTALVFNDPGNHIVTLNAELKNGHCIRMVDKEIAVLERPDPGFTSDVDDIEILCYPAQISFTSDPSLDPSIYDFFWKFGQEDFSELANPTIEFGRGTHTVTQIISNADGCKDSISQVFTLVGPAGNFTQDKDIICLGEAVTFTLRDTASISNYFWNFGDGTEAENMNPVTHTYTTRPLGDSTIITLTLESNETGCNVTQEFPIFIADIAAEIEDLGQLCRGELRLNNNSRGATSYFWDFGDGTNSTDIIPEKVYGDAGSYDIILIATDDNANCTASDTIMVTVNEEVGVYLGMPNLFTPNGDSNNDIFGPVFQAGNQEEINISVFRIYNRYGELVFDNANPEGWNGIFKSEGAPPEVYAYYIEIDISGCQTIVEKGNVTLVR